MNHPHKSTTHEEKYVHFKEVTWQFKAVSVFARKEDDGNWYTAPAYCAWEDQYERRIGRQVARRRYFNGGAALLGPEFDYDEVHAQYCINIINTDIQWDRTYLQSDHFDSHASVQE